MGPIFFEIVKKKLAFNSMSTTGGSDRSLPSELDASLRNLEGCKIKERVLFNSESERVPGDSSCVEGEKIEEESLSLGNLFLELLELKELLCFERQELDDWTLECQELEHTSNHMNRLREMEEIKKAKLELKELQFIYHELDESTEMLSLETELIKDEEARLISVLQQMEDEKGNSRGSIVKQTSRTIRHQKRRNSAFSTHQYTRSQSPPCDDIQYAPTIPPSA